MNSETATITGNEHAEWVSTLGFFKDELGIYKNRLTEVAGKNTSREIAQQVEHFQNQFIVQNEKIDQLKHDIKRNRKMMASEMQQSDNPMSPEQLNSLSEFKERVDAEDKIFSELKQEFNEFLSGVM